MKNKKVEKIDALQLENSKLKKELDHKNRELEIEASLERVRAQTMAMHNSEDVGKCTVKMFAELNFIGCG